jgi:hypothetical protein
VSRARLAAVAVGTLAIAVAAIWLGYVFLRFGPLDLVASLWADYFAWGLDYGAYLEAAERIVATGSPYATSLTTGAFEPGPTGLYYYSPVLAVALLPAVDMSWELSSSLWFVLHVLTLATACALMPVRPLTRALAFLVIAFSLPVFKDAVYGNVSTLLLLPMVMAWRWADRPLGSIAVAVGMALRPSLGLLFVWQLLRRRWRAAAWTIGAGLVLVALTLPIVGITGYLDYVAVLRNLNVPSEFGITADQGWENHDLGALAASFGATEAGVDVIRVGAILLGVGAMLLSLRRDREVSFMVTLMASMVVVPQLWDHYLAMLVIPAAFLAERWRPVALLLPLLAWLPAISAPVVMAAMLLPLLVPERTATGATTASLPQGASS